MSDVGTQLQYTYMQIVHYVLNFHNAAGSLGPLEVVAEILSTFERSIYSYKKRS